MSPTVHHTYTNTIQFFNYLYYAKFFFNEIGKESAALVFAKIFDCKVRISRVRVVNNYADMQIYL